MNFQFGIKIVTSCFCCLALWPHMALAVGTLHDTGAQQLLIIEAEEFTTNEYWSECPGVDCEDDLSNQASAFGHLLTFASMGIASKIRPAVFELFSSASI